jgi:hypothetical protein
MKLDRWNKSAWYFGERVPFAWGPGRARVSVRERIPLSTTEYPTRERVRGRLSPGHARIGVAHVHSRQDSPREDAQQYRGGARVADVAVADWRAEQRAPRRKVDWYDDRHAPTWFAWSRFARYEKRPVAVAAERTLVTTALSFLLFICWTRRDHDFVTDAAGRYALGVAAAMAIVLLLLYPLRKRAGLLIGSVASWFRLHMALGVVAPVLILFHANFRLGPPEAAVAMAALLVVAASGMVGRHLHARTHFGLYGRQATMRELLADAVALQQVCAKGLPGSDRIAAQMYGCLARAVAMRKGILAPLSTLPLLGLRAGLLHRRLRREARRLIKTEGRRRGWPRRIRKQQMTSVDKLLTLHVAVVKKAAGFELYGRLFRIWHALHLSLFMILIAAAGVHVVATHAH